MWWLPVAAVAAALGIYLYKNKNEHDAVEERRLNFQHSVEAKYSTVSQSTNVYFVITVTASPMIVGDSNISPDILEGFGLNGEFAYAEEAGKVFEALRQQCELNYNQITCTGRALVLMFGWREADGRLVMINTRTWNLCTLAR